MTIRRYNRYRALPEDFATRLRAEFPSTTVNGLILAARTKGWSLRSLGDAVGVTGEAIRLRTALASSHYALARMGEVPVVPECDYEQIARDISMGKRDIPEPEASELRRLNDISRYVNGTTRADDPRREAGVDLAYRFVTLLNQGYAPGRIGKAAGVSRSAVMMRVRRHGYIPMWASQKGPYHGHAWYENPNREES